MKFKNLLFTFICGGVLYACTTPSGTSEEQIMTPKFVTDSVVYDSDDPAIWVHPEDPAKSLIYGTDKEELDGAIFVFNLKGEVDTSRKAYPLDRPNNVDIEYGLAINDSTIVDIAVCSERGKGQIRVFQLPDLKPIDGGGIPVFESDSVYDEVMGVSLYKRPSDNSIYAIVSRKESPDPENYLSQYRLYVENDTVRGELVRRFGKYSGTKEIEAIAVDDELGYVYYSDEHYGIRKYFADPGRGNNELGVFGTAGFADDREGISIYNKPGGTGYILVSDQGANMFRAFPREGTSKDPHDHKLLAVIPVQAVSSDGSEVVSKSMGPDFPNGLFVAMSDNKTFEIYDWSDFEKIINSSIQQQ